MSENHYIKQEKGRPRLFELLIVLIVIAFIFYISIGYYIRPLEETSLSLADLHSGIFFRMVNNIHAIGKADNKNRVVVNKTTFYLNERGWPANTAKKRSPSIKNQTAAECQQLWNAIFTNPPRNQLGDSEYAENGDYLISLNKKVICRYKLVAKREAAYFIDYDVSNGAVSVVNPRRVATP